MENVLNGGRGAAVDATGSEFRLDPATGRWALIAEGRGARPTNLDSSGDKVANATVDGPDSFCPFCPGSESMTPRVSLIGARLVTGKTLFREAESDAEVDGLRWNVRVFENKYPMFRPASVVPGATDEKPSAAFEDDGAAALEAGALYQTATGLGKHEVIVDCDRHARGWSDFSDAEIESAFLAFRWRLRALRDSGKYAYSFIFKNVGSDAGASQGHSHCQLTATNFLPPDVRVEVERLIRYERGRKARGDELGFWDALLKAELADGSRIVAETGRFVALCPFASRFPMEIAIWQRFDGFFEDSDDATVSELARLARDLVAALERGRRRFDSNATSELAHNVVFRNAPSRLDGSLAEGAGLFRPRWLILPSLAKKAGYEQGSGVDVNPISPETAAERLRAVWNDVDR